MHALNHLVKKVKKASVQERKDIFLNAYKQIIPSLKRNQSKGMLASSVRDFDDLGQSTVLYVANGLVNTGSHNQANRVFKHYGLDEECLDGIISSVHEKIESQNTDSDPSAQDFMDECINNLVHQLDDIFNDGKERGYTKTEVAEYLTKKSSLDSEKSIYLYHGENLEDSVKKVRSMLLGKETVDANIIKDAKKMDDLLQGEGHSGLSSRYVLSNLLFRTSKKFRFTLASAKSIKYMQYAGNIRENLEHVHGDDAFMQMNSIDPKLVEFLTTMEETGYTIRNTDFIPSIFKPELISKTLVRPQNGIYINGMGVGTRSENLAFVEYAKKAGLETGTFSDVILMGTDGMVGSNLLNNVKKGVMHNNFTLEFVGDGFGDTSYKLASLARDEAKKLGKPYLLFVKEDRKSSDPKWAQKFLDESDVTYVNYSDEMDAINQFDKMYKGFLSKEDSSNLITYRAIGFEPLTGDSQSQTDYAVEHFRHTGAIRSKNVVPMGIKSSNIDSEQLADVFSVLPMYVAVVGKNSDEKTEDRILELVKSHYDSKDGTALIIAAPTGSQILKECAKIKEVIPIGYDANSEYDLGSKIEDAYNAIFNAEIPCFMRQELYEKQVKQSLLTTFSIN